MNNFDCNVIDEFVDDCVINNLNEVIRALVNIHGISLKGVYIITNKDNMYYDAINTNGFDYIKNEFGLRVELLTFDVDIKTINVIPIIHDQIIYKIKEPMIDIDIK